MPYPLISPPPWQLTGNGCVLLFHFPRDFNRKYGFLASYQTTSYQGWIGAVMMVDYQTSGVGPYQELLYIPGLFSMAGRLAFSISKIYVSTEASVRSGQENWGIPKELADFSFTIQNDGSRLFSVSQEGHPFFRALVKPLGPRLPFTTRLLPPLRITQQYHDRLVQTRIEASGNFCFSRLRSLSVQPSFFPPVDYLKPLLALSIHDFHLLFPKPLTF
jgi:hypothetical protein